MRRDVENLCQCMRCDTNANDIGTKDELLKQNELSAGAFVSPGRNYVRQGCAGDLRMETRDLTIMDIFVKWKYAEMQTYNRLSKYSFRGNNRGRGA